MQIIGHGFLAGHLARLVDMHDDAVAVAAGVSWASGTSEGDFAREAALVREVAAECRSTGRTMVFFSTASAGVYGPDRPGREDDAVTARSAYGAHKLGLEDAVRSCGVDHLILRLGHLVGSGQPHHQLLPTLIRSLEAGRVTIQRLATRDLIDVGHVVEIIDALLEKGVRQQTVNVASGWAVPVAQVVDFLEERLGLAAERDYLDGGTAHRVCVDKLSTLVPRIAAFEFGRDYYRRALGPLVAERVGGVGAG